MYQKSISLTMRLATPIVVNKITQMTINIQLRSVYSQTGSETVINSSSSNNNKNQVNKIYIPQTVIITFTIVMSIDEEDIYNSRNKNNLNDDSPRQ